jgi:hypothetical protein
MFVVLFDQVTMNNDGAALSGWSRRVINHSCKNRSSQNHVTFLFIWISLYVSGLCLGNPFCSLWPYIRWIDYLWDILALVLVSYFGSILLICQGTGVSDLSLFSVFYSIGISGCLCLGIIKEELKYCVGIIKNYWCVRWYRGAIIFRVILSCVIIAHGWDHSW